MKVSANWITYKQNTNIKCSCDTLIQLNDNKMTKAFEQSCVLPEWCTGGNCDKKKRISVFDVKKFVVVDRHRS